MSHYDGSLGYNPLYPNPLKPTPRGLPLNAAFRPEDGDDEDEDILPLSTLDYTGSRRHRSPSSTSHRQHGRSPSPPRIVEPHRDPKLRQDIEEHINKRCQGTAVLHSFAFMDVLAGSSPAVEVEVVLHPVTIIGGSTTSHAPSHPLLAFRATSFFKGISLVQLHGAMASQDTHGQEVPHWDNRNLARLDGAKQREAEKHLQDLPSALKQVHVLLAEHIDTRLGGPHEPARRSHEHAWEAELQAVIGHVKAEDQAGGDWLHAISTQGHFIGRLAWTWTGTEHCLFEVVASGHSLVQLKPLLLPDRRPVDFALFAGLPVYTNTPLGTHARYSAYTAVPPPSATFRILGLIQGGDRDDVFCTSYPVVLSAMKRVLTVDHDGAPHTPELYPLLPQVGDNSNALAQTVRKARSRATSSTSLRPPSVHKVPSVKGLFGRLSRKNSPER
ncbi:hypothetical protein JCM10207_002532 [Rhodosporidiobolus poonsookiae]